MKPVKKILALILAGVMALALLTGCGKAASLDRTIAEGMAEYAKSRFAETGNDNNISVSYQVPELRRNIAPLFDENWVKYDENNEWYVLNEDHMINGKSIKDTLTDIMSPYESATSITLLITDVTDTKTPFMETSALLSSSLGCLVKGNMNESLFTATNVRIAVVHKNVNGHTYALGVIITEE